MIVVLLPLLLGFFGCAVVQAQLTVPNCTVALQSWATNNENQSPCQVAIALINACQPGIPDLPPLTPPNSYNPPTGTSVNACTCSSVTYSMISACGVCQGSLAGAWSGQGTKSWIANCPTDITSLMFFPQPVPSGVFIPTWAFLDVSANGGFFSPDTAQQIAEQHSPDVTTGVDPLPSSTTPAPSGASSSGASLSSSGSSSKQTGTSPPAQGQKETSGGVIAGAVVGSLVGVACIALIAFFYTRYRKERQPRRHYEGNYEKKEESNEPSLFKGSNGQSTTGLPVVNYPPLKLYDPEDPSTFPTEPLSALVAPTSPSAVSSFTHSRNDSEETAVSQIRPTHSRQSSDTTSIQSSTLTGTGAMVRNPSTNNAGYNPSGIIYRTIPE